jgi:hypothetical protein
MAERDSGAWPNLPLDQSAHDTSVPDAQAGAQADWPDSSALEFGQSTPDRGSGQGSDTLAGWTTAGSTGPSAGWGTDPDATWTSGSGTQPSDVWNPGHGTSSDTGESAVLDGQGTSSPTEAPKPGERRARHAGKHGRPARRPWDRSGKDRDGEQ